eukprot:TRINITY_DN60684_c0_g1_i1.p1 TRINITY_DN60684_c0_g1~~TRINITY_DN60684_c0_g1_i1.p1  ORF type:complete len:210 (+),score=61.24 TRINITY_DN60684_c0_g1_i1:71-631(+)
MGHRHGRVQGLFGLLLVAFAGLSALHVTFLGVFKTSGMAAKVTCRSFQTGKVNLAPEALQGKVPEPVLLCDESTRLAILECVEEGCSVEALMEFDARLAKDEEKIKQSLDKLQAANKMDATEENSKRLAWYDNFLRRTSSLRAQLLSVKKVKDVDFTQQFMKAAAVAFGGGRPTDYPKIGVSPYTA